MQSIFFLSGIYNFLGHMFLEGFWIISPILAYKNGSSNKSVKWPLRGWDGMGCLGKLRVIFSMTKLIFWGVEVPKKHATRLFGDFRVSVILDYQSHQRNQ
jgi:hypothetical protein